MGSETTSNIHYVLRHVFAGGEVDKMFRSGFQDQVFFASRVDADDTKSDSTRRNLGRQMAKASKDSVSDTFASLPSHW